MNYNQHIAKNLRAIHFGRTWTWANIKNILSDVNYREATHKIKDFNTIAALTFHINYYIAGVIEVLENRPFLIKDKFSFDLQEITSEDDWQKLQEKVYNDANMCADLIEKLPNNKLFETFVDEEWGSYFRNLHGLIEHSHYHLGQIVILKKIIKSNLL